METIKKNWVNWLITILTAILVSIITLAMTNRSARNKDYEDKVDQLELKKLDRDEFIKFSDKNENSHKEIVEKQSIQNAETTRILQLILQQETANTVNINWLIENEKKKNR